MDVLPTFILKEVKYKLSDVLRSDVKVVELPFEFDLKDPEVLLEQCEYDFAIEKRLVSSNQDENQSEFEKNSDFNEPNRKFQLKKQVHLDESNGSPPRHSDVNEETRPDSGFTAFQDLQHALPQSTEVKATSNPGLRAPVAARRHKHKHKSAVDKHNDDVGVPSSKTNVLDQLTDLLTDDVKHTETLD